MSHMNSILSLSVVISYCPNEKIFIDRVVDECLKFSKDIIVVQSDHYFNGEEIPYDDRYRTNKNNVKVFTIQYDKNIAKEKGVRYYHNRFREFGWKNSTGDYILFLDADEVPDGDRFREWLKLFKLELFSAVSLDAYWYFRDTTNQSLTTEETSLIFKSKDLFSELFYNNQERWGMFFYKQSEPQERHRMIRNQIDPISKEPLIHHYSWVRTKEEMIRKVSSWGHKNDEIDWKTLVEKEFEHEFDGTDFVHGYKYKKVKSFI